MLPGNVRKTVRFSNDKTIDAYISKDNLPDYLGGTGEQSKNYRGVIPDNLKTTAEILNINGEDYKKVKKYYEKSRSIIDARPIETTVE